MTANTSNELEFTTMVTVAMMMMMSTKGTMSGVETHVTGMDVRVEGSCYLLVHPGLPPAIEV